MGKFRTKLKRSSGGKRWPKGDSCVSNATSRKYRAAATALLGGCAALPNHTSNLTIDALHKHDAVQSYINTTTPLSEPSEDSKSCITSASSASSYKSFASEWSGCTNMSYARFLHVAYHPNSYLHQEMLAILKSATDIIKMEGAEESNTAYFCILLRTVDEFYDGENKDETKVAAALALLNIGVKKVSGGILRKCFDDTIKKMIHILKEYADASKRLILTSVINIIAELLRYQDFAEWSNSSVSQPFEAILNPFCIHSNPKIRKAARQAVTYVVSSFKTFHKDGVQNIPAMKVAEFCIGVLEQSISGNSGIASLSNIQAGQTTILHTLIFMKDTICYYPKAQIKKSCEMIFSLISLNAPLVTSCGMQVLNALFSAQFPVVSGNLNSQIIGALYEYQPSINDIQPIEAWLFVLRQAHIHLADVDMDIAGASLPKFFATVTQLWLSERTEIANGKFLQDTLEIVLKDAVAPLCATKENVDKYRSKLLKCFNTIELGLGYQYHTVWKRVLYIIGIMFEAGGPNCSDMFSGVLKSLAELRDSYRFSYNDDLEEAVGAAIRALGPEVVLGFISLRRENGDLNMERSWLLIVLKKHIKFSTIAFFINGILPLATYCHNQGLQLAEQNDGIGSHSYQLLYTQLWNLLPCFCKQPSDIKGNFTRIARILGTAISEAKELRLSVMASLKKLIKFAQKESEDPEDLAQIARFDKNFLPILFNLYTTKPIGTDEASHRSVALETIEMYLSISHSEVIIQLFTSSLERLNAQSEDPEDSFIKESILDLLKELIPYINKENITTLYEQCIKSLPGITNTKEQKKAYRLLEKICHAESPACVEFIQEHRKEIYSILQKSFDVAVDASKDARLKCYNYLIKSQPQLDHTSRLIRSIIPEAIIACNDIKKVTRNCAHEVLNTIADTLIKHNQINELLTLLVPGLAGTPDLMRATVLALSSLLHNFSGIFGTKNVELILDNVATLCTSSTRAVVESCLVFLNEYIRSFPSPMVAASLPTIMKALTNMNKDCLGKFRLDVRDILAKLLRKYGFDALAPHINNCNETLYKMLRNLRKINARKKRRKEEERDADKDDFDDNDGSVKSKPKSIEDILADSDSDLEEMETDEPKTKKSIKTWIQEDPDSIVDFADSAATSRIRATKPSQTAAAGTENKEPPKDRGFKTAPDGRLIIADGTDSDGDSGQKDTNSDDADSDEGESVAGTLSLKNKKRKRCDASIKSGFTSRSSLYSANKYKAGGSGIHRPLGKSALSVRSDQTGHDYQAKKAKGDMKKKGKPDPYAYLPLQRSTLNKRKKKKAAGQFKHIVKGARAGALKGAKAKSRIKN